MSCENLLSCSVMMRLVVLCAGSGGWTHSCPHRGLRWHLLLTACFPHGTATLSRPCNKSCLILQSHKSSSTPPSPYPHPCRLTT